MKLAEALAMRSDLQTRLEQLRSRIASSARYQEGDTPAEDAAALLREGVALTQQLETLISAINRTNGRVRLEDGRSISDALAGRDTLRLRHSLLSDAAEAATGQGGARQLRSELRQISALDVPAVRAQADDVARELRELDARIQQTNWSVDLAE